MTEMKRSEKPQSIDQIYREGLRRQTPPGALRAFVRGELPPAPKAGIDWAGFGDGILGVLGVLFWLGLIGLALYGATKFIKWAWFN